MFTCLITLWAFCLCALLSVCAGLLAVFFLRGCSSNFINKSKMMQLIVLPYYLLARLSASLVECWRGLLGSQSVAWKQATE